MIASIKWSCVVTMATRSHPINWIKDSNAHKEIVNQALVKIDGLGKQDKVDEVNFRSISENQSDNQAYSLFREFCDKLRSRNGTLSQFWIRSDLVTLLLNLIQASREGNWSLHLQSVNELIPWCFAYNRCNYSRYLSWYYREMSCLLETHPEFNYYLENGGFSCQIGSFNTFGRIPIDQTIEETINKDTQTAGGTKGFSTKRDAVSKYYITANDRARFVKEMRSMVDIRNQEFCHHDMTNTRITRDERDVQSLYNMMAETWKNPFELSGEELCNISTGSVPSLEGVKVCDAKQHDEAAYGLFVKERLRENRSKNFFENIPKMKLQQFITKSIKSKTTSEKEIELKADKNIFSIMTIVAQNRKLDMKDVFSHPLGPVPWSLSKVVVP